MQAPSGGRRASFHLRDNARALRPQSRDKGGGAWANLTLRRDQNTDCVQNFEMISQKQILANVTKCHKLHFAGKFFVCPGGSSYQAKVKRRLMLAFLALSDICVLCFYLT